MSRQNVPKKEEKKKHVPKAPQINDSLARSHSLHLQSYRPRQLPSKNIWIYLMEWKIGGNGESDPRGFLSPLYSFHIFNTTTLPCESANTLMHIIQSKGCHFRILIYITHSKSCCTTLAVPWGLTLSSHITDRSRQWATKHLRPETNSKYVNTCTFSYASSVLWLWNVSIHNLYASTGPSQ